MSVNENTTFSYNIEEECKKPFNDEEASKVITDITEDEFYEQLERMPIEQRAIVTIVNDGAEYISYLEFDQYEKIIVKFNLMTFGYLGHGPHVLQKVLKIINHSFKNKQFEKESDFMLYNYKGNDGKSLNSPDSSHYTVTIEFKK